MTESRARLTGTAVFLPERRISVAEREAQVAAASAPYRPPAGMVTRLTGVEAVHVAAPDQDASDLAVLAAQKVLAGTGAQAGDIDLMIFAAGTKDLGEPATAHIVAAKLGLTCPVFDVTNACNSVLNAVEVTQALIASGRYRNVLITCGEVPSTVVRLRVPDAAAYARAFASYGFSDAGAALLFTAGPAGPSAPGVLGCRFLADSTAWPAATVTYGGTRDLRDGRAEHRYFRMDDTRLRASLFARMPELHASLEEWGLALTDFAFIGVHQVATSDIERLRREAGVPEDRLIRTLPRHGNVASASLPLQLSRALETGRANPGDLVALLGLAAGSSAGLVVLRL